MADKLKPTDIDIENMTKPTKEQIDPCLNCDSATCMREYDYPCNDRIRYLYKLQKNERKKKNSTKQGNIWEEQYASKN